MKKLIQYFIKCFCKHDWKTKTTKSVENEVSIVVDETEYWYKPMFDKRIIVETTKVLICKKCGEVKIIKY